MRHVEVTELGEQRFPFLHGSFAPALKGFLCGGDSIVDILLRADWDFPRQFSRDRIGRTMFGLATTKLTIDNIAEAIPGNG